MKYWLMVTWQPGNYRTAFSVTKFPQLIATNQQQGKTEGSQLMAEGDTSDVVLTLPYPTCLALAAASLRGKCSK